MRMKRFLSAAIALMMIFSMTMLSAGAAVQPTDTMVQLFPGVQLPGGSWEHNFRDAVIAQINAQKENEKAFFYYDTVTKEGTFGVPQALKDVDSIEVLTGAKLEDVLAHYVGSIVYDGKNLIDAKKITDIQGIEYLLRANTVDLGHNEIKDFSFLGSLGEGHYGLSIEGYEAYLSKNGEEREQGDNVYWMLSGNPFTKLPESFGGHLVIQQPGTASYTYESEINSFAFLRGNAEQTFEGSIDIHRCDIVASNSVVTPVKIISCAGNKHGSTNPYVPKIEWERDADIAKFSGVSLSTKSYIAVGIDEEIAYSTADEWGTVTPGAQSFKYYIPYNVIVCDRLTVGWEDSVTLSKIDQYGDPVAGAKYELYKIKNENETEISPATRIGDYLTSDNGVLAITEGLSLGTFTLQEVEAPGGYELNKNLLEFKIEDGVREITVTGGTREFTPTGETELTPASNETFLTGKDTHNITLAPESGIDEGMTVHVIYTSLISGFDEHGAIKGRGQETYTFGTLAQAQAHINGKKDANLIAGAVKVNVSVPGKNAVTLPDQVDYKTPPNIPSTPTVSVKGQKVWEDDNNSGDTRPTSIKVELYRDNGDQPYRTATVTASNDWKYSFTGLTKYRTGNTPHVYTVQEVDVPEGYSSAVHSVTGSTGNTVTTTITNTLTPPEKAPVTPEEPTEPVDPNAPNNPGEPPTTPPAEPGDPTEPPTTPPAEPGKPGEPLVVPSPPPHLPQTGTASSAAALDVAVPALLAGLAVLFAAVAIFLWRRRGRYDT